MKRSGTTGRVHDQVFSDATYTAGECLIVAVTLEDVISRHSRRRETTRFCSNTSRSQLSP